MAALAEIGDYKRPSWGLDLSAKAVKAAQEYVRVDASSLQWNSADIEPPSPSLPSGGSPPTRDSQTANPSKSAKPTFFLSSYHPRASR